MSLAPVAENRYIFAMTTAGATQIIAGNVRAELARGGYSQSDIRRSLNLTRAAAFRRWHGETPWSAVELSHIADRIGAPLDTLLAGAVVGSPA